MNSQPESTSTLTPTELIAARIRELRTDRGWSLADLAERLRQLGIPLHKSTASKVEHAERRVPLDEVLAFAYALDVAPVHLFSPPDLEIDDLRVQVVPGVAPGPYVLRRWIRGQVPLTGQDARRYELNAPFAEWGAKRGTRRDRLVAVAEEARHAIQDGDKAGAANALAEVGHLVQGLRQELGIPAEPWLTVESDDEEV